MKKFEWKVEAGSSTAAVELPISLISMTLDALPVIFTTNQDIVEAVQDMTELFVEVLADFPYRLTEAMVEGIMIQFAEDTSQESLTATLHKGIVEFCRGHYSDFKTRARDSVEKINPKKIAKTFTQEEVVCIVYCYLDPFVRAYIEAIVEYTSKQSDAVKSYSIKQALDNCTFQTLFSKNHERSLYYLIGDIKSIFMEYHTNMIIKQRDTASRAVFSPPGESTSAVVQFAGDYQNIISNKSVWEPLRAFVEYIKLCHEAGRKRGGSYYAPYTSVCQGSCSGKSFLAVNSKSEFAMTYINLRDPEDRTGVPPRSSSVADYFLSLTNTDDILLFYLSIFEEVLIQIPEEKMDLNTYFRTVNNEKFWKVVVERCRKSIAVKPSTTSLKKNLNDSIIRCQRMFERAPLFLFVIDEARTMLNVECTIDDEKKTLFSVWRRAIHELLQLPVFFVIIDTTSRLSNFQPSQQFFQSARYDSPGKELFPPFYCFPFTGEWLVNNSCKYKMKIPLNEHEVQKNMITYDLSLPVRFSRPFFKTLANKEMAENESLDDAGARVWISLCEFAMSKIKPKATEKDKQFLLDRSSRSALLSCKYALVSLDYDLSEDLVSSFCGTLVYVSPDRSALQVNYVPEPMLAEAVCQVLEDEMTFQIALGHLHDLLINRKVTPASSKGDLGEFVATIYFLRVKDMITMKFLNKLNQQLSGGDTRASQQPDKCYSIPTPVGYFLTCLGVKTTAFENYTISYTAVHKVHTNITKEMLRDGMKKNYGLICQDEQKAVDELIPILYCPPEIEDYDKIVDNLDNISAIALQMKDYAATISENKAFHYCKIQADHIRINILGGGPRNVISILMAVEGGVTGVDGVKCMEVAVNKSDFLNTKDNTYSVKTVPDTPDLFIIISQLPVINGIIDEGVVGKLNELLRIQGIGPLLQNQIVNVVCRAYGGPKSTKFESVGQQVINGFSNYLSAALPQCFQADNWGSDIKLLQSFSKVAITKWQEEPMTAGKRHIDKYSNQQRKRQKLETSVLEKVSFDSRLKNMLVPVPIQNNLYLAIGHELIRLKIECGNCKLWVKNDLVQKYMKKTLLNISKPIDESIYKDKLIKADQSATWDSSKLAKLLENPDSSEKKEFVLKAASRVFKMVVNVYEAKELNKYISSPVVPPELLNSYDGTIESCTNDKPTIDLFKCTVEGEGDCYVCLKLKEEGE